LGIAQLLAGNGKFCWIYQHPSRTTGGVVRGSFPNENHFAHFLALGLGCLIWWAQGLMRDRAKQSSRFHTRTSWRDRQRLEPMLVCGALALVVLAGMLTFSRGGVAVLLLAGASCVALMTWQGLLNKKALLALAGVAVVLIAALGIHGYDKLSAEWGTVAQAETAEDLLDVRLALWQSHLRAIPQFFWTGTGAGSHAEIVPTYFDRYHAREFTHAENGPLQVLLELGVGGGLLLATGLGLSFWWLGVALWRRSSTRVTAAAIAVFAGLLVSVVHSLWDFAWYIPACMSITLILVACAVRLHRLSAADYDQKTEGVELPRLAWGGATVAVVMASAVMLHTTWGPALAGLHWDRYLIASYASNQQDLDAQQRHNLDAAMMTHLSNVLRHHPDHARANLRMTAVCLRRFDALQQHAENAIPLAQIRDAALASQFDSREALDRWLAAAVGDHRQLLDVALFRARQGLRGCPLQGGGYLYLAELSFLQGLPPETKADFVDQALRVRPHDGQVLFAAGREAIMAGDINGAMHRWKQAFHISPPLRREIVRMLGALPAPMLIQAFEPDLPGLTLIYRNYLDLGQPEQAALVAPLYLQALHKAADGATARRAANHWVAASQVHEKQGDAAAAVQCARKAVDADPSAFGAHRNLAHVLAAHGWHDEAVEHYQWCLHRKPDDQALRARMKAAVRGRLDAQSPASAAHPTASETSRR